MTPALLSASSLTIVRGDRSVCNGANLHIAARECVHLTGPNGSGKTSLLQALSGLLEPEGGTVAWTQNGGEQPAHYCAHQDGLKQVWTVAENLRWQIALSGQAVKRACWAEPLAAMRLDDLLDIPVAQLSQGQKRRASLMRLALIPRLVWLLDEPFNALDPEGQNCLVQWINLHIQNAGAVLFTSHIEAPAALAVTRRLSMETMA